MIDIKNPKIHQSILDAIDSGLPIVVSFSGGRSSAYMAYNMLKYYPKDRLYFLFANTSKENEETLIFIEECSKQWEIEIVWVEAVVNPEKGKGTKHRVVNFDTAKRKGEVFESVIDKYGIPNVSFPNCTRELKQRPINSYCREAFPHGFYYAIGMRIDEANRLDESTDSNNIYPLTYDQRFIANKNVVRRFWEKQPFDLKLDNYQGNCDLCWKKTRNKKLRILAENPEKGEWWRRMEEKYALNEEDLFDYHHSRGGTRVFGREYEPMHELIRISKEKNKQCSLFDMDTISENKQCGCFKNMGSDYGGWSEHDVIDRD